jgi:5-methylcytosine-specific restriction endonuclease McrA
MRGTNTAKGRHRLETDRYRELHGQVLKRDGWRCQFCGGMRQLQVHHIRFRSHSGADEEQNLITLCTSCHDRLHSSVGIDVAGR